MIDLYMWGTANGLRAAVALAETGLAHRVHKVDITKGEQKKPEFEKLNPVGAIPVIVDHDGPGGKPLTLAQSGAIVVYACEKAGKFIPTDPVRRAMASQWFLCAASDVAGTSSAVFNLEMNVPEKSAPNTDFFKGRLEDGRKVTVELFRALLAEELPKVRTTLGEEAWQAGKYEEGARLFDRLTTGEYVEFLTLPAYQMID